VSNEAITMFWQAWPSVRTLLEAEIEAGEYGEGTETLTDLVEDIHPQLEWELMAGRKAEHALAISSAAEPRLRPLTQAWVDAAPSPDEMWEYHPARIPVGPEEIELNGRMLDPLRADMVAIVDPESEMLDLQIGHPDFADLDETLRFQAAFRFIDDLIGEDDTEAWIGSVDVFEQALSWGVPLTNLPDDIARLKEAATHDQWATVNLDDKELGRSILVINRALKRLLNLSFTLHVQLSIELPGDGTTSTADEVEDDLEAALGDRGELYARETFASFVVLSAYAAPRMRGAIMLLEDEHESLYDVEFTDDPGWDRYEELR
jgi:hypothetical protein